MEKVSYHGWNNAYRLHNGTMEIVVVTDVGPRIIFCGFSGEQNFFKNFEDMLGLQGGDEWRIYGGHRFWHAPEDPVRTYYPDNTPVTIEDHGEFVRTIQDTEPTTGLQKELDLKIWADKNRVTITHRLRNNSLWPIETAPWGLSVMAQSGLCIFPTPPRGSHEGNLLPSHTMTFWAYTNMRDPRWSWGYEFTTLQQDPAQSIPQKLGASVVDGWAAYALNNQLFVKTFNYEPGATYPDRGANFETFTNDVFLEMESLGPLTSLAPAATVEHTENWYLFRDMPTPTTEVDIEAHIVPALRQAGIIATES